MIRDIELNDALCLKKARYIDVRSPDEYQDAAIPGAINLPLLGNSERQEIGIIYKQEGPQAARNRGLELIGPALADLVARIQQEAADGDVVLYCWRGGERSKAVSQLLNIMHVSGYRLIGGFREYRRHVVRRLAELPTGKVVVIHGLTGTGKTEIIQHLRQMGHPAVDLEDLANHRGSVFGSVGLGDQPSQKEFDNKLLLELDWAEKFGYVIVESESRKIGKLFLPEKLFDGMKNGLHVQIYDTIYGRIRRLQKEYVDNQRIQENELLLAAQGLERYIGKKKVSQLEELINGKKFPDAIEILLVDYYDPLYGYKSEPDESFDLNVDGNDSERAAEVLTEWLKDVCKEGFRVG
ncbi:MAG: tRNA 2-selenouridine(34) synthase MnmH [Acidobacteriota bacterium]